MRTAREGRSNASQAFAYGTELRSRGRRDSHHVFERALCDLKIEASDEESRDELAQLIVEIASDITHLDVESLLDRVKVAWAWRYGGGK
jgi:hypothetical protein